MSQVNENNYFYKIMGYSLSVSSIFLFKYLYDRFNTVKENKKTIEMLTGICEKINKNIIELKNKKNDKENDLSNYDNIDLIFDLKAPKLNNNLSYYDKKRKFSEYENIDLYKIVFTGGPCAGKTTAIASISEKLRELGYSVFCIPEAASLIFQAGGNLDLTNYTEEQQIRFQYHLMTLQTNLEDSLTDLAFTNSNKKKVILCDRGVMDGSAYLSEDLWHQLIDEYNIDITRLRDKRYDLVIHLVTAANGAEKHFSQVNNSARHEQLEYAIELDKNIQNAYFSHPNYYCIDNESQENFQTKINQTINIVMKQIGIGESYKFKNKFFLRDPYNKLLNLLSSSEENIKINRFELEDLILFFGDDKVEYYRRRKSTNNGFNFIKCTKSLDFKNPFEIKRQIHRREFLSIKNINIENKFKIKRERLNLAWEKKILVIDRFNIDGLNFMIMNEQTNNLTVNKGYPKIIENNIYKNISDIKEYTPEYFAKNGLNSLSEEDKNELNKFIS